MLCLVCGFAAFIAGALFANVGDTTPAVGGLMSGPALWLTGAGLLAPKR